MGNNLFRGILAGALVLAISGGLASCNIFDDGCDDDYGNYHYDDYYAVDEKPVIYLYPQEKCEISVGLEFNGRLTVTDPPYTDGWRVTADAEGTLTTADGNVYPYLFWEGEQYFGLAREEGFCVSGADTEEFLKEKLALLGLSESESAEFCEYWLPRMESNAYNIISFHGKDYTDNARLNISPAPDTVIRVFMSFSASEEYVNLPAQDLQAAPGRNGFTVVEWGGAEIR